MLVGSLDSSPDVTPQVHSRKEKTVRAFVQTYIGWNSPRRVITRSYVVRNAQHSLDM